MKEFLLFFILHFSFFLFQSYAQLPDGKYILPARISGEDTIPMVDLPPVDITGSLSPEALKKLQKYSKLKRDVRKTLPYAKLAAIKLNEINAGVEKLKTEKEKKIYVKVEEKKLKDQFTDELTNLTISQGRILIKLIDRETGATSYALIKELRGSFQAFLWQGLARLFGENLKSEYDSLSEDKAIEQIIHELDSEGTK